MIYFDNAATTKPSVNALQTANKFNTENFFNPSTLYMGGLNSSKEIKKAKESVLRNLSALNFDVCFTSCGTESDNMAVFSIKRGVIVTDKGEHSAVYKSFLEQKNRNVAVEFIDLNADGTVNTDKLYYYIKNNKVNFVSIVHVNNETGGINDINKIAEAVKNIDRNIIFHSDGVQAYGKLPYKLSKNIDMYSISAHKINGLKGVGALIYKKNLNVAPLIFGGGQENGLRSGTENLFGIKVFEYAGIEHYSNLIENFNKVSEIKKYIKNNLDKEYFTVISSENSTPYILTVSAKGLRGEVIMHTLENDGIIIGNGSACSSKNRFSRVIKECGFKNDVLDGVIRLSFSQDNTQDEAVKVVKALNDTAKKFKGIMN